MKSIAALLVILAVCEAGVIYDHQYAQLAQLEDQCVKGPLDIAFIFDSSSSVWGVNFTKAQNFVRSFLTPFSISSTEVRIAVEMFGDRVYVGPNDIYYFTSPQSSSAVDTFVKNLEWKFAERTETGMAIKFMRENIMSQARPGVRRICIIITDGESQQNEVTVREARLAREANIQMMAIGVSDKANVKELRDIAGDDRQVFIVKTYSELDQIKQNLFGEACRVKTTPAPPVETTTKKSCCCDKD